MGKQKAEHQELWDKTQFTICRTIEFLNGSSNRSIEEIYSALTDLSDKIEETIYK